MTFPNQLNVNATPTRLVSPTFDESVGFGMMPGFQRVFLIGYAPTINIASAPCDLIPQATLYPFQTTAQTLRIASSSASDTAAGTGARTIVINGLDANFNPISETVTMNGTSNVLTTNQYLRVNPPFQVASAGSAAVNVGNITATTAGSAVLAYMSAGLGIAQQAVYTVPAGYAALSNEVFLDMPGASTQFSGTASVWRRDTTTNSSYLGIRFSINSGFPFIASFTSGTYLNEKSDITWRVNNVESDGTPMAGAIQILVGTKSAIAQLTGQ